MPNPYLEAALRAQDEQRPKKSSATKKAAEKKAAESAAKSDSNTPSKES